MFRKFIAELYRTNPRAVIRNPRRARLTGEMLEGREVPATIYWNPVGGSTDATLDNNWHVELENVRRKPGPADDVRFEFVRVGSNDPCDGFGAAGAYKSVGLFEDYTATVTLSHGFETFDFTLQDGKISQPVANTDIFTKNFYWTGGELNSSATNSQKLTVKGGTAIIQPEGGTLTTRDMIVFATGATATFYQGIVLFAGGNGMKIEANSAVRLQPFGNTGPVELKAADNANGAKQIVAQGEFRLKHLGSPGTEWGKSDLPIFVDGGDLITEWDTKMDFKNNYTISVAGVPFPPGSVVMDSGEVSVCVNSILEATEGMRMTGGELNAHVPADATAGLLARRATIAGNLNVTGGLVRFHSVS